MFVERIDKMIEAFRQAAPTKLFRLSSSLEADKDKI